MMKKGLAALSLILSIGLISACSMDHRDNRLEDASYRAAGKGDPVIIGETRSDDQATAIEQRVKAIPGVRDAHVLVYGVDNLIVGIQTGGPSLPTVTESQVRQELQGESKHYLIYLVTDETPDLLTHIASTRERIRRGEDVRDRDMTDLMNAVWKTIVPFNFLSKT